jgi:outer membrane receptor for ferric coprogen and ferric-rhodotorulic acid
MITGWPENSLERTLSNLLNKKNLKNGLYVIANELHHHLMGKPRNVGITLLLL